MIDKLYEEVEKEKNPKHAELAQRYFKTGKGQYGEGDVFLGLRNPVARKIAKKYTNLSFEDLQKLLDNKHHEIRLIGLLILVDKYKKNKKNAIEKMKICRFYLENTRNINNWDLVDLSAPNIVGDFSLHEGNETIRQLAKSKNIWEKRIAIISTFAFIKHRNLGETLAVADMLLNDKHDLIHKAVGWALREVGKENREVLEIFLKTRYKTMPRTMLRYSIEKFPEDLRKRYLKGEI